MCFRHPGREAYIQCQRCLRPICPDCMNPAAVGFQCPDCVKQGSRDTRSGRTAYGGIRSENPGLTSLVLIGINAVVWLFILGTGGSKSEWVNRLALMPRGSCLLSDQPGWHDASRDTAAACAASPRPTEWVAGMVDGAWWQLLTSMFTHVDLTHVAFNLLALWFLGPQLEHLVGRVRFLAIYLVSGLAGSATVYWFSDPDGLTLGASGAIFGLMGALLVIGLKAGGDITPLLVWLGINVVITFTGANISWQGHLGGLVGGALLALVIAFAPRAHRAYWQAAGVVLVLALVAGAIVGRTAVLA